MSKNIGSEPRNIAPEITGTLFDDGHIVVYDKRTNRLLDPANVLDKIAIYERQVTEWFIKPAIKLSKNIDEGFICLMICLSYIEGVEQYRQGKNSKGNSSIFFKSSLNRIYTNVFSNSELQNIFDEARNGLFHDGMSRGSVIISNTYAKSIEFNSDELLINPQMLIADIKQDFESYIQELYTVEESRKLFDKLFSVTK